ncbi:MAG: glycoside hydrolase family 116 protein [Anaerolineae bacterium]|nr:glycoside hydrolase family 116 protein [Anaerolineae bacterium]
MSNLRRWQIESPVKLAADARVSQTDYSDDQVWELVLGKGESPALQLQTRYGGRAGLASLVPMWTHDGRSIYQAQTFQKPPVVTAIAPGYTEVEATLTPHLTLKAMYWAMDSHATGTQFTLANTHTAAIEIRLDVVGFVGNSGKEQKVRLISMGENSGKALSLGAIGNLQPIVLLEGSTKEADASTASAKIGRTLTIEGGKTATVRFVHAGRPDINESLALAQKWLQTDWNQYFAQIQGVAATIPDIETGDDALDKILAFSYQELVSAFLKPTTNLPNGSFVATRSSGHGFHDGNTADRGWNGQSPTLAYPVALGIASINPVMAQGVIRNYLAVQRPDGWIDGKPGLGGQKQGVLCLPILARLAWGIFQYTEDAPFLRETFPKLQRFFERWLQSDLDQDGDGLPEWQSENQTGYVFTPTFSTWQAWGQGADIRLIEAPDLAAYLLSEARSLKEIAYFLRETDAEQKLSAQIERLQNTLDNLWNDKLRRYTYRDRDSHQTTTSKIIIHDAKGMDELLPAEPILPPNRLIVRVEGGVNLVPRMTLKLDGLDANRQAVSETATSEQFIWATGRGVYTSQQVFSQIDRVQFEGLSRVYRIDVHTVDTTRLDLHSLLPLWAGIAQPARVKMLLDILTSDRFWRQSGVTMNAASDPNFDPSNAEGSGGVWPYWVTLIGEALIEAGEMERAADLLQRLLTTQTAVFLRQGGFSEFYHSDEAIGLGERGHLAGIAPLYLFMRVMGVRVISSTKVWVGGRFAWEEPVTIRQHGVTVRRSHQNTQVEFPSGYTKDVMGEDWQEIIDQNA